MKKNKRPFFTRGFVSMLMAFCFIGLAVSGIVLYFSPPCSIADRTGWTLLAFTKTQWASLHQVSALMILVLAVIHLFVYNWRVFTCYFKRKKYRRYKQEESKATGSVLSRVKIPREVFASVIVAVVVYAGALTLIAPFGWLHDGSDAVRDYYRQEAPAGTGMGQGLGDRDGLGPGDRDGSGTRRSADRPDERSAIPSAERPEDRRSMDNETERRTDNPEDEGRGAGTGDPQGRGEGGRGEGSGDPEGRGEGGRGEGSGDPEGRGEGGRGEGSGDPQGRGEGGRYDGLRDASGSGRGQGGEGRGEGGGGRSGNG